MRVWRIGSPPSITALPRQDNASSSSTAPEVAHPSREASLAIPDSGSLELRRPSLQIPNSCRYTKRPTLFAQAAKTRIPNPVRPSHPAASRTQPEKLGYSLVKAWLESCVFTKMNLVELDEGFDKLRKI
jgi:hypothetical protein